MKLICLGDSTMQKNKEKAYPQIGWPQVLAEYFKKDLKIINFGKNKLSTRTAFSLKIFDNVLKGIDEQPYVLIQLAHNDSLEHAKERYAPASTLFYNNLNKMIDACIKKEAKIILMTPTFPLRYEDDDLIVNPLGDYPRVIREIAIERGIFLVDCYLQMYNVFKGQSKEENKEYVMWFSDGIYNNYPMGLSDGTHLRAKGGHLVAQIFINSLQKENHPLAKYLLKEEYNE